MNQSDHRSGSTVKTNWRRVIAGSRPVRKLLQMAVTQTSERSEMIWNTQQYDILYSTLFLYIIYAKNTIILILFTNIKIAPKNSSGK